MLPAAALVLWGMLWIALGFIAYAIFAAFVPLAGAALAAAITALIFLILAGIGAYIVSLTVNHKIQTAKKNLLVGGLATSGAAKIAIALITKRPMLILGLGGAALAAFLMRGSGQQK